MEPYTDGGFPWGIHLIFVPLTLAIGFLLGWIVRSKAGGAGKDRARERRMPEES